MNNIKNEEEGELEEGEREGGKGCWEKKLYDVHVPAPQGAYKVHVLQKY